MMSSANEGDASSVEDPELVLNNVLHWIRSQHGNALPVEVVHLLPPSAQASDSTTKNPARLIKEEPSDISVEPFLHSRTSSPLPEQSSPSADTTSSWSMEDDTETAFLDPLMDSDSAPSSPFPEQPATSNSDDIKIVDIGLILSPKPLLSTHKCPDCYQEFVSLRSLTQHTVTHSSETPKGEDVKESTGERAIGKRRNPNAAKKAKEKRPVHFKCRICDEEFDSSPEYRQHLKLYPLHRAYKCPTCSMTFGSSIQLSRHVTEKHEGGQGQPHVCTECGEKFKHPQSLKSHLGRVHKHGEAFKCNVCEKVFYSRRNYKRHEDIHLNRNRKECPHCAALINPHHFRQHIETVHEGKREKCKLCGKVFGVGKSGKAHLATVHPEVADTVSVAEAFTSVYLDPATIRRRSKPGIHKPRARITSKRRKRQKPEPEPA